jgi:hypothetical protein
VIGTPRLSELGLVDRERTRARHPQS